MVAESPVPRPPAPSARAVVRGAAWIALSNAISQLAVLAAVLTLATLVSPADFGTVAAAMVMVQLALLLMSAGTAGAIVSAGRLEAGLVRRSLELNVATGVLIGAVFVLLANPITDLIANGGDPDVVRALFGSIALYSFSIVPIAVLMKRLEFRRQAVAMTASAVLASAAAVLAGVLGAGVWSLVLRVVLYCGLLAVLGWVAARGMVPLRGARAARPIRGRLARRPGAAAFAVLAATNFVALQVDYLIIGSQDSVTSLGLYSLAFLLAFAPLTQFSWQIGKVLFPAAAATDDAGVVGDRTLRVMRLTGVVLLPLAPPAIALAPELLPGLLGEEWREMVRPFQILLAAGMAQGVLNCLGEALSGTGHIGFLARVDVVWCLCLAAVLVVMILADGIRGAAIAHAVMFLPRAFVYVARGGPRIGVAPARMWRAMAPVLAPVAAQALVTTAVAIALGAAGAPGLVAAAAGAAAGFSAALLLLRIAPSRPLEEGRAFIVALRSRLA